ncbi:hypothetical protein [Pseudomonas knackmussii]|uniref:hypothetical protein n=1 Tax=Pseudomonas knackmussii TaxID=65741 RepID=UPI001363B7EB|nr:hypothetical protein [Pseudomonas knackmussii]
MTLEVDVWQLISMLLGFLGVLFTLGKVLLAQIDKRLEQRFKAVETQVENFQNLERQFLRFQADLPLHYVRREDYVRNQTVIEAKLDALASKLEIIQINGARHD